MAVGRVIAAAVADPVLFSLFLATFANGVTIFQSFIAVHAGLALLLHGNRRQSHSFRNVTKPVS